MAFSGNWLLDGTGYFFFNDTATTEIYTLSLHDALPISGYNFQSGAWVLGIEVDANYFGLKDKSSEEHTSELQSYLNYACSLLLGSDWLVTVRPRIGYAFDRWLVYATGGLAVANQKLAQR